MPTLINSFSLSSTIGIGTDLPNKALTVVGDISATNLIYDTNGNSNQWNNTTTTYNNLSSSYISKTMALAFSIAL